MSCLRIHATERRDVRSSDQVKALNVSLIIGGTVAAVPLAVGWIMFQIPSTDPLTHILYPLFGVGLPGMLIESLVMSSSEPHGGGTPLEMLLIVFPLNTMIYAAVTYVPVSVMAILIRGRKKRATDSRDSGGRE